MALLVIITCSVGILGFLLSANSGRRGFPMMPFILGSFFLVGVGVWGYSEAGLYTVSHTELLHGTVLKKGNDLRSCTHCRDECTTTTKSDGTTDRDCEEVCDHLQDRVWWVQTDTKVEGSTVEEERCRGTSCGEPSWSEAVKKGEAISRPHQYENWILAQEDIILRPPPRPEVSGSVPGQGVCTGLRNRLEASPVWGAAIARGPETPWQKAFRDLNTSWNQRHAGKAGKLQAASVCVLVRQGEVREWSRKVAGAWVYGPKNQVTFTLQVQDGQIVESDVFGFYEVQSGADSTLRLATQRDLKGLPLEPDMITDAIWELMEDHYRRTPMATIDYLKKDVKPTPGGIAVLALVMAFATFLTFMGCIFLQDKLN